MGDRHCLRMWLARADSPKVAVVKNEVRLGALQPKQRQSTQRSYPV